MRITNVQKKELADIFKSNGLNLLDFEMGGQYKEFTLKFKHDYFSFSINKRKEDEYLCNVLSVDSTEPVGRIQAWVGIKGLFQTWTKAIALELNTPTGWESFENTNFLNEGFEQMTDSFTESEKAQVRQNIIDLKEKVLTLELPQTTLKIIEKKLDDLSSKVDESNKFDWKSLFVGTVASLIMTLSIPPTAAGLLWEYIKTTFGLKLNA